MKRSIIAAAILLLGVAAAADTTTTRLLLTKPTIGSAGWAPKINTNYDLIDSKVGCVACTNAWTLQNTWAGPSTFNGEVVFNSSVTMNHSSVVVATSAFNSGGYGFSSFPTTGLRFDGSLFYLTVGNNVMIQADEGTATSIAGDVTFPTGGLSANGFVESLSGGFVFPDGSTQTVAAQNFSGTADRLVATDSGGDLSVTSLGQINGSTLTITRLDPSSGLGGGFSTTSCGPGGCYQFEKGVSNGIEFDLPVNLGDSDGADTIWLQGKTRVFWSAGAPAATSCGTSPSVSGTDVAFKVTVGTADPNDCAVSFTSTWTSIPICTVTAVAAGSPTVNLSALSATALTIDWDDAEDLSSDVLNVICLGLP